jgi:alanyl-tRNA synthetase
VKIGHEVVKSSSLVPDNDPTLMFTNSGMVQFKDVFTGKKNLPYTKATTAQKSLRAGGKHNDLENVGYTVRHHTFFEMLGNFSFGDYFKEEAINFAWEFVTKKLELPKDRLLVTVHSSDDEAAAFWRKIAGLEESKIIRIPTSDNFWTMGDIGPCGPCSEIFYDHGDSVPGGPPGSSDENGDRFIEIWNLVFMQFETTPDGSRTNLPKPSIDTGMGLERIAAILQGVHNTYDIDLFQHIKSEIKHILNTNDRKYTSHYNVIADHIRAISFMIADGIIPSNEGRGYVVRRIIRRALRHGYMTGMKEPFLYKLTDSVKQVMGEHYAELVNCENMIKQILKSEEDNFMRTIDKGMHILRSELDALGSATIFPTDVAYKLYDTFGFPFDLTQDILRNENKKVDEMAFEKIVSEQKELSKKAWIGTGDNFTDKVWYEIKESIMEVKFLRNTNSLKSEILYIVKDSEIVDSISKDEEIFIVTTQTPFYAESGGQIGDKGYIKSESGIAKVLNTITIAGVITHKCVVEAGVIKSNSIAVLEIDIAKRRACSKNHTATHVLQKALKIVLGDHVAQKGSLVTDEKLRFDFVHNGAISSQDVEKIERIILDMIDSAMQVSTEIMNIEDAKKSGAVALFGERYPNVVRVVTIGDDFSKEFCGGEHVANTSQIGCFKLLSVSSIGSGIKRIEAITGRALREYFESEILDRNEKIANQNSIIKNFEKQIVDLKTNSVVNEIVMSTENIAFVTLKYSKLTDVNQKIILGLIDKEKDKNKCIVIGNISSKNDGLFICIYVGENLLSKMTALDILHQLKVSFNLDIKLRGKEELVQCGGLKGSDFEEYIQYIKEEIGKAVK